MAAALSRFSLAFSPKPFCESGLRAEEACREWMIKEELYQ